MDVENSFLNGDSEKRKFSIPSRFGKGTDKHKTCKLKKLLYDLKQSPKTWFEHFENIIRYHDYYQSQVDHTMFYKHLKEDKIVILNVYVDDIILIGHHNIDLERLK